MQFWGKISALAALKISYIIFKISKIFKNYFFPKKKLCEQMFPK